MTTEDKLPRRITVTNVLSSRYAPGQRPVSWDERTEGEEEVETEESGAIRLNSNGGQSSPAPGWELLLTTLTPKGYEWTLFGIKHASND